MKGVVHLLANMNGGDGGGDGPPAAAPVSAPASAPTSAPRSKDVTSLHNGAPHHAAGHASRTLTHAPADYNTIFTNAKVTAPNPLSLSLLSFRPRGRYPPFPPSRQPDPPSPLLPQAGMENVDVERVKRIVYEMSKDSPHFANERKKEEAAAMRVARLQVLLFGPLPRTLPLSPAVWRRRPLVSDWPCWNGRLTRTPPPLACRRRRRA